ncbi:hypothetical protein [Streptomyces sp. NPDC000410]|uniref:ATP-grasp domain-containing protein n=1 Tax=Streptomyces sp. NPDC000410 TaxID=3154254 RepID=UPI003324B616
MLLVHDVGGPPLEYAVPRVAAHADVHVLALAPLPTARRGLWHPLCASVSERAEGDTRTEVVERIKGRAAEVGAEVVLTLSERAVVAVARACEDLGLAGVGPNAALPGDRHAVRSIWRRAGVPAPLSMPVSDEQDIRKAFVRLRPPLRLTSVRGGAVTGGAALCTVREAVSAWRGAHAMRSMAGERSGDLDDPHSEGGFLMEEIVSGSTDGWFEKPGWGDIVSVEGIVAGGVYQALCISGRLPTALPFLERGSVTPVAMPVLLQRRIERVVREAVEALDLGTCATHTCVRLGAGGRLWVMGTALRFGGVPLARQAEEVYGLDMIGMLVCQLLGRPVAYPRRMLTKGQGAAASLVVPQVAEAGEVPPGPRAWDFTAVDWRAVLAPESSIQVVPGLSRRDGAHAEAGDRGDGDRMTVCFVIGRDANTVLRDCGRIVDALPALMGSSAMTSTDVGAFEEFTGILLGQGYVQVVVDRQTRDVHVLDRTQHAFHLHFIADRLLKMDRDVLHAGIEDFQHSVYRDPDRRFLLGVLSMHHRAGGACMVLETSAADTMGAALLIEFHAAVRARVDPGMSLYVKPANHDQQAALKSCMVPADGIGFDLAEPPSGFVEPVRHHAPLALAAPRREPSLIVPLSQLRVTDEMAYGIEAANLGELHHVLCHGSTHLSRYYAAARPPRPHLLGRLADRLGAPRASTADQLAALAGSFLRSHVSAPEGIAVPLAVQRDFFVGSAEIQQLMGMLQTALQRERTQDVDALCAKLQHLVRTTVLPDSILRVLITSLVRHVPGTQALVVRSSSSVGGLPGYPARECLIFRVSPGVDASWDCSGATGCR